MKHKGSMGNGQGRSVEKALVAAEEAAEKIVEMKSVMGRMNDKQRKLFVALSRQKDPLVACLEAGYNEWFTGIVKVLDLNDEAKTDKKTIMPADKLTMENLWMISDNSYQRLVSICENRITKQVAGADLKDHIESINDYLQLIAPDAYAVIGDIMLDKEVKPETRLKAAADLLDRGGYKPGAGSGAGEAPVSIHINLPGASAPIQAEIIRDVGERE